MGQFYVTVDTPTAKLSLEEMARLVSNKLQAYETNTLSQSQAEALASLSGQLTRLVGAESLQQSITSAITGFVAEIEAIQSNPHLDPDSKQIMTAQVQSLLNTFCNQARQ